MHVDTANTQGNTNIGLYAFATDTYCVLGPEAENLKPQLEAVLNVPVVVTTIAGTSLAGVFLAGNAQTLLIPDIAFEHEIKALKQAGVSVQSVSTTHTALGNNIVANEHGALIGPMFSEQQRAHIEKLLGVETHLFRIAETEVVGSGMIITTKGGLIHSQATQFEQDMAQDILRLPRLLPGTVNFGSPYVRSGIIANSNGFLIGSSSGGPEITNADEALGFIDA